MPDIEFFFEEAMPLCSIVVRIHCTVQIFSEILFLQKLSIKKKNSKNYFFSFSWGAEPQNKDKNKLLDLWRRGVAIYHLARRAHS